ncbi:MFS transporter [Pokkaliibacter sp. MBI-7]|uniref:MFS transporter n=1 Tax=Pokkaliibacter sp. MBI-7 TaxID=3040600 RepID=UPI00244CDC9E|nr:MFS transporter [Pokkaliibacter sp. MBI-7]MDH2434867.1 MFS transporter [Pokkaliibacter sp. MBI-7]
MIRRWLLDPVNRLLLLTGVTVLLALSFISAVAIFSSGQTLLPLLAQKADAETRVVKDKLERALSLGIPLQHLVGIDELYQQLAASDSDLDFLVVSTPATGTDPAGQVLYKTGNGANSATDVLAAPLSHPHLHLDLPAYQQVRQAVLVTSQPLLLGEQQVATLYLGHPQRALLRPLLDNLQDIGIVLLVALLLSFELMLLVLTLNLSLPTRTAIRVLGEVAEQRFTLLYGYLNRDALGRLMQNVNGIIQRGANAVTPQLTRENHLVGVRLLTFLFVFAEELARPIMPSYFADLAATVPGLDVNVGAGIIMALHMMIAAVVLPVGSLIYDRIGRLRLYMIGAILATLGLLGTGLANSYWDLVFWRALSAIGYGTTFVACQGFVLESTTRQNRARGTAMMLSGLMLADICGPAIGGILVSHIGAATTFQIGACASLLAALAVTRLMSGVADHREAPPKLTFAAFGDTFRNRHFLALLFLSAIPAKLFLSGFLYYLVPLTLISSGISVADVGRILMLYGLVALLAGPALASITDRLERPIYAVIVGSALTAAGMLSLTLHPSVMTTIASVVCLGAGQALSIPAQISSAITLSASAIEKHGQGPVIGSLRLVERLGGGTGPIVAGALAAHLDAQGAVAIFTAIAWSCCLLSLLMALPGRREASPC